MLHVQILRGVGRVGCPVDAGGGWCDGVGVGVGYKLGGGLWRGAWGDADAHCFPSFLPCGVAGWVLVDYAYRITCLRVYVNMVMVIYSRFRDILYYGCIMVSYAIAVCLLGVLCGSLIASVVQACADRVGPCAAFLAALAASGVLLRVLYNSRFFASSVPALHFGELRRMLYSSIREPNVANCYTYGGICVTIMLRS